MDGDFDLELDDGAGDDDEHAAAIVACLGDDAAHLRLENPESEIADNMDEAALLIELLRGRVALLEREKDGAYLERNQVVAALAKCFPAGVARTAIEGWSEDWHGCVFIDLPTGQASWHYHESQAHLFAGQAPYPGAWDGHTTAEKYERLAQLKPLPWRAGLVPAGWLASGMHLITHEEVRLAKEAGFEVSEVFKVKGGA
ncbi:hypothetical protein [Hydrogenophaga sp.]